ncbi:hypothetical protein A176_004809 [Myxococcus hansupus]|uniref:Uncharacterized protein n=1 Tax=Pseudomyxococcus hansupus TaxID=1297742 RepID=A0A0H4XI18_9BACT|nr:hypothetical protein A176_004809 [Myxococcus hansupus]
MPGWHRHFARRRDEEAPPRSDTWPYDLAYGHWREDRFANTVRAGARNTCVIQSIGEPTLLLSELP